ncbi:gliding motility-associated C-terminal domain-containing protein [uncultured Fibrella sp.]|uniref:gliding motility-associated C-terminal domain-containing protein n=1 Tax=uncultured Fibrella sp. TaxID=1284596 RepID=UPI0035CABD70
MVFQVRYGLCSIAWVVVWLFAGITTSLAQTSPNSASIIQQTEQQNKIKIVGSLCTPTAPSTGTASGNASCGNDPVNFYDVDPAADKAKTQWVIDGGAPQTGVVASTSFTSPGVKTITITRTISTTATSTSVVSSTVLPSTSFTVSVGTPPSSFQKWRSDTTICKGTVLTIDPYPNGAPSSPSSTSLTYLWFPKGETTQSISTTASGCYSVEVTNEAGCSYQDRIRVSLCPEESGSPGSKWYFGNNAGLDFGGDSPKPLTDGKLSTIEGSASITDTKGNILFYSDGITVYDKDGKPMQVYDPISGSLTSSSAVLGGNKYSTQSAIIVPKPVCHGCDYLYYVYTTAEINGSRQITYSVVDMRRNSGSGAVVQQNLPVVTSSTSASSTERSASVRNDKDTTYWVMTHDYGTNCFRVDHLTPSTTVDQKSYCLGMAHDSPVRGEGQIKIGPAPTPPVTTTGTSGTVSSGTVVSGTATAGNSNTAVRPVAVVIPGDPNSTDPDRQKSYVQIFSFNTETGVLSGPTKTIDLGPAPPKAYGVEFSPDGSKVYVSLLGEVTSVSGVQTQTGPSRIVQFDITADDPVSTSALIDESTTRQYGSLQIGPDGKIYVAVQDQPSLGVIDNANGSGTVTTNPFAKPPIFTVSGQDLGGKISQLGLPNQVANFTQPSSSAGISASNVCQGDPVTFQITPFCPKLKEMYNLTVRNSSGAVVAQVLSFTQTSQTVQLSTPDTYSATLDVRVITSTGATCTTATAETSLTVIEQPKPFSVGPDIDKCTDKPVSVTITAVAEEYAWVLNRRVVSRSKVLTTTVPGTYTAFIGNGGECFESDVIVINIRIPPRLNLGPDQTLCENGTRTIGVPAVQGYQQYLWSNGATTREINITQPGMYSVTGSFTTLDNVVCEASDDIKVIPVKKPVLTTTLTNPAGCTTVDGAILVTPAPTLVVSGTASPTNSFTYSWTTVSGTPISTMGNSASALTQGTYAIRVTDENACATDASFELRSKALPLVLTAQPGPQRCDVPRSGSVTLGISGGTPSGYVWQNSSGAVVSTGPSLTGVAAGIYSVSVVDNIGCIASLTGVNVSLDTRSALSLGPDRSKCVGDTIQLTPQDGGPQASVAYRWNNGTTTRTISVNTAGTYSLTTTNALNGCIGNAAVQVQFVQKPNVSAGANLSLCLGAPQSITSLQLTGNSPGGGSWTGPNVNPSGTFTPSAAGIGQVVTLIYSVTVNGCANSAPRQIALKQTPQVNAGPDAEFCEGTVQVLQASGSPGATFRWSDGTQGSQLRPQQTGRYTVTANVDGCEQTDAVDVNVKPAPRFALTREAAICIGDNQQTQLRVVPQEIGQVVVWTTTNTTSTTLLVSQVGTYSVVVTGTNGCIARDAARVIDLCEPRLFVPNAFSPNGDGTNDKFGTLNAYTTDLELRIYNRWGEVIFASTPETPEWDGTYRGEPAQTMVYPYVITYRSQYFPERPSVVKRGSVLLLR